MGKRAQRIPSWPGVIHSNKGRIHLRRPTRDITFRLRQSGGPYIPVCYHSEGGRPVIARALSGAIRRCSRKLPGDNLRPPIALDSPVALSPVLCCAASELLACRLALTSVCAELHLLSRALGYFGASATVRAKSLPTGGTPGRRNWRPRSLRDTPFHSTHATSGAGSDGPIHDGPLPTKAEMICPALSVAAAMFECSCVALLRDRLCLDAAPQVAASECLLLVH